MKTDQSTPTVSVQARRGDADSQWGIKGPWRWTLTSPRYLCIAHGDTPKRTILGIPRNPSSTRWYHHGSKMPEARVLAPPEHNPRGGGTRSMGGALGKSWPRSRPGLQCNVTRLTHQGKQSVTECRNTDRKRVSFGPPLRKNNNKTSETVGSN